MKDVSPCYLDRLEWAKFVIKSGDDADYPDAFDVLQTFADNGNPEAQYYLGLMYARGQGTRKNFAMAREWFTKASDQGNLGAMYFLGKMYASDKFGEPADQVRAASLLRRPSDAGDVRASYNLALLYLDGIGVKRDLEESFKLMLKAAEGGYREAQFVTGQFYKTGAGCEKDVNEAVHWLSAAAANGHRGSQLLLGDMYTNGDGVPRDPATAERWYGMTDGRFV